MKVPKACLRKHKFDSRIIDKKSHHVCPDKSPEFPGGQDAMEAFIHKKIGYPQIKTGGRTAYCSFDISETDRTENVKILRGLNPKIDSSIVDAVRHMPKWKPALTEGGKPIKINYSIPIRINFE